MFFLFLASASYFDMGWDNHTNSLFENSLRGAAGSWTRVRFLLVNSVIILSDLIFDIKLFSDWLILLAPTPNSPRFNLIIMVARGLLSASLSDGWSSREVSRNGDRARLGIPYPETRVPSSECRRSNLGAKPLD